MASDDRSNHNRDEQNWGEAIGERYLSGLVNGIKVFIWVGAVFLGVGVFGYGVCAVRPQSDLIQLVIGILAVTLLLGYFALLMQIGNADLMPYNFVVLGSALAVTSMLVRGFGGPPLFVDIGNASEEVRACRVQMTQTWFGDLGLVWAVASFLVGGAWRYFEEKKQRRYAEIKEQMSRIEQTSLSRPLFAATEWALFTGKLTSEEQKMFMGIIERVRERYFENWTHAILSRIDWLLFSGASLDEGEIQTFVDLLISINTPASMGAQMYEAQVDAAGNEASRAQGHWVKIKTLMNWHKLEGDHRGSRLEESRKSREKVLEGVLDSVLWMWREYDVLAREWVVALIEKWLTDFPEEREETKDAISDLHHTRRLTRHTQIRALFPDLYISPTYDFQSPWPVQPPNCLSRNVQRWLEERWLEGRRKRRKRKNPFGMARAEWEEVTTDDVYYPDNGRLIERMMEDAMLWIVAPPGSGRTKLAQIAYSHLTQSEKTVVPIYMMLDISEEAAISRYLLEQLLHHLVVMWGGILLQRIEKKTTQNKHPFNGPIAFLDLDYHEQRKVAQLFFWEMGSLEAIWTWLTALGVDLAGTIERKALKARLEFLLRDPPPQTLPESWMMDLASARPVGLSSTFVLLELNNTISQDQALRVMSAAERLQQEKIYLKIIASQQSPAVCLQTQLFWTEKDLRAMLDKRDISGIMDSGAKEALAKFIHAYANSSPREMMRLGSIALALRAERDAEKDDEKPDKEADLLPMAPTEEKVLTEEDIKEAIQVYKIFRFHKP